MGRYGLLVAAFVAGASFRCLWPLAWLAERALTGPTTAVDITEQGNQLRLESAYLEPLEDGGFGSAHTATSEAA